MKALAALLLLPALALAAPTYVGTTNEPYITKQTVNPPPVGANLANYWTSGDMNNARTFMDELRAHGKHYVAIADYGVTGSGLVDESALINTALTAAPAGAVIVFHPGTYLLAANPVTPKSGQTLLCSAGAKFKRANSNDTVRMMYLLNVNHVTVKGCSFDANGINQPPVSNATTKELIRVDTATDITFEDNEVANTHWYLLWASDVTRLNVNRNHFMGGEGAVNAHAASVFIGGGSVGSFDVKVTNNTFEPQSPQYGVSLVAWEDVNAHPSIMGKGLVFANNTWRNSFGTALNTENPGLPSAIMPVPITIQAAWTGFTVTGNYIEGDWAMGMSLAAVQDGAVTGNYIEVGDSFSGTTWLQNHMGIEVTHDNNITLAGNTINGRGFLRRGFAINGAARPAGDVAFTSQRINATGNTFHNMGGVGTGTRVIEIFQARDLLISSNVMDGNSASDYGIAVIGPGGDNITISSNTVKNFTNYPIYAEGPQGGVSGYSYGNGLSITGNTAACVACNAAIQVHNYSNSSITGNSVFNPGGGVGVGVGAFGAVGVLVGGMVVTNNSGWPAAGGVTGIWFGNLASGARFDLTNKFEAYGEGTPGGGFIPAGYMIKNVHPGFGGNGSEMFVTGWIARANGCANSVFTGGCNPATEGGTTTFAEMKVVTTVFNAANQGVAKTLFGQKAPWTPCPDTSIPGNVLGTNCSGTNGLLLNAGAEVATDVPITGASTNGIQTCSVTIPADVVTVNRGLTYRCIVGISAAQYLAGAGGSTANNVAIVLKNPTGVGVQPGSYNYNVTVTLAQ